MAPKDMRLIPPLVGAAGAGVCTDASRTAVLVFMFGLVEVVEFLRERAGAEGELPKVAGGAIGGLGGRRRLHAVTVHGAFGGEGERFVRQTEFKLGDGFTF